MRNCISAVVSVLAIVAAGCSSAERQSNETRHESTDAATTSPHAELGSGTIAGKPFTSTAQFVQFDVLANVWRLHIVDGDHDCSEDLASTRPAVGIDFLEPTDLAATPPSIGTHHDLGVVFVPADRASTFGPATTTTGVTLTVEHDPLDPGQRWTGHLTVLPFEVDGLSDGFDGPLDAEVCAPATS